MAEHILFLYTFCDQIPAGKTQIAEDGCFVFEPAPGISAFSVYLFDWTAELTTKQLAPQRYRLQYAMGYFDEAQYAHRPLRLPEARCGSITVAFDFSCADGIYYSEHSAFVRARYYDPEKHLLAFGDLNADGACIAFAEGQIAVIDDTGTLRALYVALAKT